MRWYLRYPLSYRNLEEMMEERGVDVDHTTLYRWVQKYSPELEKRIRWHARTFCRSWHLDETRSEEHTSELQSLMRISYAVFCLKKKSRVLMRYGPTPHNMCIHL